MSKPHFEHDCTTGVCRFIDSFVHEGATLDLYYHDYHGLPEHSTVILRYGDDGPEYYSLFLSGALDATQGKWQRAAQLLKEPKNV